MDTTAFITSLATSFAIFVILMLFFTWLSGRPLNHVIYYPNRLVKQLGPPENANQRRPFDCVREAWRASEEDVIAMAGLDAAVYLIFISSMLSILFYTACYCLPVLVALSATDNENARNATSESQNFSTFDNLAMGNIQPKSNRIWAFVIGAYWLSLCTYYVLWRSYRHVAELRALDQASPVSRPEHFAVLVRDIPRPSNSSYAEEVDTFFRRLYPATYEKSLVVTDISKVSKSWSEVEKCRRKLAGAEMELAGKSGRRPRRRSGWMELVGQKVDAIEMYNERLKELVPKWEAERERTLAERQQGAAFVFFNSRVAAAGAGQTMLAEYAHKWTVGQAPDPRAVAWDNLPMVLTERLARQFVVYTLVFLMICFYMIPIAFISALITIDQLEKKLPFLKPLVEQPVAKALLQAYLPQLALLLFLALLPAILQKLSKAEGLASLAEIQRAAAGKYFYFNVFNVFLGVTLASTLFAALRQLINHPTSVVDLLSTSLPPQASFFITFIALRFLVGYGLELSRLVPLCLYHLKRKFVCKTEDELREAWNPGPLPYGTLVPSDMLVVTVVVCYAIIAPMILPFGIAYFALAWLVMRNQLLNVYVTNFESCGRMWPHMHSRIVAALFVSQLTMLGYFSTKAEKKFYLAIFMIPPPFATLIYAYICSRIYYPSFRETPLCRACDEVKQMPSVQAIVEEYTPTCLLEEEKFVDMDMFEDARSNLSSVPSSSGFMSPAYSKDE